MAGSYMHVTDRLTGEFEGLDTIDNLGDAYEAIEEMHDMIGWMARQLSPDDPRHAIHEAWREGHLRARAPYNLDDLSLTGFEAYWRPDDD